MSLDAGFWSCPWHDPSSCKELRLCWILCLAHHRSYLCHILHRRIPRQTGTAEKLLESRGHGELFQESKKIQFVLFRGFGALDLFLEPEQESLLFYSWSSTQFGKSGNETKTWHSRCFHRFVNCQTIYFIYITNKDKLLGFVLFCCSYQGRHVLLKT